MPAPAGIPARGAPDGGVLNDGVPDGGGPGDTGRTLLRVRRFDTPFLLTASLSAGAGSSELTLDRGKSGKGRLAEFRRLSGRAVLVLRDKHHLATGDPAAVRAGADSFARSVVWSAPVLREDADGALIDPAGLALTDLHGIADLLRERGQGEHTVDPAASYPLPANAGARGVRLPALLTLRGPGTGAALRAVTPAPAALTVVQQVHLVPLPDPPLPARAYHPASGGYGIGHVDHGADGARVMYQPRFRLEPTDPDAASGPVRRPIVFLVDPAVPEPWRSAVVEGGNWWREAFEAAGFQDAYRVEVAPADADLDDPALNTVWWVHRDGRGWSHGQALTDPRTGEILHGRVRLGSQRVEQVTALAEALLAPYGHPDEAPRLAVVRATVLARMRLLAAHEIGHALGFLHNFASTGHPRPSVMDYPHPEVTVGPDGAPDLSRAYPSGLGPWDHFLVAHAYGRFPGDTPAAESAGLARLRREAAEAGLLHLADDDARGPGAAHADAAVWVPHSRDPFDALEQALAVRRAAQAAFTPGVVPPDRQSGELEARAALLHLYHRHHLAAVTRLVGGVRYAYAQAGDTLPGTVRGTPAVAADDQWRALRTAAGLLRPEHLVPHPAVLAALTPPAIRYARSPEYLDTRAGRVFDPLSAVESATALVTEPLLEPAQLNRLAWQHANDPRLPGVRDVVTALLDATWPQNGNGNGNESRGESANEGESENATGTGAEAGAGAGVRSGNGNGSGPGTGNADGPPSTAGALVLETAGWVVVRQVGAAVRGGELHHPVREELKAAVRALAVRLRASGEGEGAPGGAAEDAARRRETARTLTAFLEGAPAHTPADPRLDPLPRVPPGAPL
ncbi:zinc-dependent metalloprotease [Streptomyces griseoviridis]|uniref:zinc-dependent metalloprotease n=1 Tax=Streptomyces griseoviridis TaxID=45398 RepID=UPI0023EA56BB|nr:zinc-dependent metalloprotease [Streptomyces griseoviridis]